MVINTNLDNATSDILDNIVESVGDITSAVSDSITNIHDNISEGLDDMNKTILGGLEEYSDAIGSLVDKINNITVNEGSSSKDNNSSNKQNPTSASTNDIIAEMKANSAAWHTASASEKIILEERNQYLGDLIGAKYDSASGEWSYPKTTSSSSKGSSSSGKTSSSNSSSGSSSSSSGSSSSSNSNATATIPGLGKVNVDINSSGKTTTSGLPVGTVVHTSGGDYKITGGSGGNYTSVKVNADGSRYTSGGLNLIGEEGFEAFITNNGLLVPITQPTLGNIGAGGVIFNQEQMANLRNLWDWSNIGKISSSVPSLNTNKQHTVIDNSIHINGLTVGEQGNEDWINGFRRYVATHR